MNWNNFFDKANKAYKMGETLLAKALKTQESQMQSRIHSCSNDQLTSMAKKMSDEGGGSPVVETMLYEEMHRRGMK